MGVLFFPYFCEKCHISITGGFNYMKKFTAIVLMIIFVMGLAACGGEATVEEAYLEGYDEMPFDKACRAAGDKIVEAAEDKEITYSVLWGEGWAGDAVPKEPSVSDDEKLVMCEIRFTVTENETEDKKRLKIYMIHDTKENILTIEGGNDIGKIFVKSIEADETKQIVMDFLEGKY